MSETRKVESMQEKEAAFAKIQGCIGPRLRNYRCKQKSTSRLEGARPSYLQLIIFNSHMNSVLNFDVE